MLRRLVIGAAIAASALAPLSAVASASRAGLTVDSALERLVLREVNSVRTSRGLAPLRLSAALSAAADRHSREMAVGGFFAHESPDGSSYANRVDRFYRPGGCRSWSVGETIAWASPGLGADQALRLWIESPPHREILLSPRWRDLGLGALHDPAAPGFYSGREVTLITADFGRC